MRLRPAENWLAHAYGDVMSSASKMAASLHPASRKRSTSAFSISPWTADRLVKAKSTKDFQVGRFPLMCRISKRLFSQSKFGCHRR